MDMNFVVLTPKDQGVHNNYRVLSQVNSHIATVKSARLKAGGKATLAGQGLRFLVTLTDPSDKQRTAPTTSTALPTELGRLVQDHHDETDEDIARRNISRLYASSGLDQQLLSPLDPFLRLPVQVSPREHSLLQFWLRAGRCYAFNTSSEPEYCPALYTAQRMLSRSAVCALAHVVAAEAMHHRIRGEPQSPSSSFYLRRAQTYRAMYERLNDQQSTFHETLADLMQMAHMEMMLGQVQLLAQHIQALRACIRSAGGMAFIMSQGQKLGTPLLDWQCYLSMDLLLCLQVDVQIPTLDTLDTILHHFRSSLEQIREWILTTTRTDYSQPPLQPNTVNPLRRTQLQLPSQPPSRLKTLRTYFRWLIKSAFNLNAHATPYREQAGAFCIIYRLCWTQVKYKYSAVQSEQLLERFESMIEHSTQISVEQAGDREKTTDGNPSAAHNANANANAGDAERGDFCRYRPNILASSNALSVLHYDIMPTRQPDADIQFWDTTVGAVRLLPLMNSQRRLMLVEQFMRCAFLVPDTMDTLHRTVSAADYRGYFGANQVERLENEIRDIWMAKQRGHESMSLPSSVT